MSTPSFEQAGWSRLDITPPAQDRLESAFRAAGVDVDVLDVSDHLAKFDTWRQLPEYDGEYKNYPGDLVHCLSEKALEHFLSVVFANPKPGMTAVDIGSCRSVVPTILRRVYGVRCLEQDLTYPAGVHADRVGSSADAIPLQAGSVDFMTLHCTFEHFESGADTGFVAECARLLRPHGRVVILPLYLNETHCNITGETNAAVRATIGWDDTAQHYCEIPEWQNRFGRHYSAAALLERVIKPAIRAGLKPRLVKVTNWSAVDPNLWLRWILILEQQGAPDTRLEDLEQQVARLQAKLTHIDQVLEKAQAKWWYQMGRRLKLL